MQLTIKDLKRNEVTDILHRFAQFTGYPIQGGLMKYVSSSTVYVNATPQETNIIDNTGELLLDLDNQILIISSGVLTEAEILDILPEKQRTRVTF